MSERNPGESNDDILSGHENYEELGDAVKDLNAKMRYQITGLLRQQSGEIKALREAQAAAALAGFNAILEARFEAAIRTKIEGG